MSLDSNPDARKYRIAAEQRFEDAEILLANRRPNGSIYLAGFAVECMLKALILANTTVRQRAKVLADVKSLYGHNLEALRREVARRGIHMRLEVVEEFRRLAPWSNDLRYGVRIQSIQDAESLLQAAAVVMQWAERVGRASREEENRD